MSALEKWRERLDYLLAEEAIVTGPDRRFELKKRIEEARAKLDEFEAGVEQITLTRNRHGSEPGMVTIPEGDFLLGSLENDKGVAPHETPQTQKFLDAFQISRFPITNQQYARFVQSRLQAAIAVSAPAGWQGYRLPADQAKCPVRGVTWHDALAYCEWLTSLTDREFRLPTELHWEKAARGQDGRKYPWGNRWREGRCNDSPGQVTPVDQYGPQNSWGCYDLVGNLSEWTCSLWGRASLEPDPEYQYPLDVDETQDLLAASDYIFRVVRGGAAGLRCGARAGAQPNLSGQRIGFRVMRAAPPEMTSAHF